MPRRPSKNSPNAATLGVAISPQALDQRFTASAAACLEQVLLAAIARNHCGAATIPLLQRFTAVYVQDSSTIVLPEVFAAQWHCCGGSTASETSAALKLQARLEMCTGASTSSSKRGEPRIVPCSCRGHCQPGPCAG